MSLASLRINRLKEDRVFFERLLELTQRERACLRHLALTGKAAWSPDALVVVAPYLPPVGGRFRDDEVLRLSAVATLYAYHPSRYGASLGRALSKVPANKEAAAERLARACINATNVELLVSGPLPRVTRLLADAEIAIDWTSVLNDLAEWNGPRKTAQQRLATDFWGRRTS